MSRSLTLDELDRLSRLLDGELSPDAAAALRAEIAADPALGRAWATMRALPAALHDLPLEIPPSRLDERLFVPPPVSGDAVAGQTGEQAAAPSGSSPWRSRSVAPATASGVASGASRPPSRWPVVGVAVGLLVAASALLSVRAPADASRVRVRSGVSHFEGRVDVLAGNRVIALDGEADVRVEPTSGGAEAFVSVTVLQGVATVRGPEGGSEALQEGDTRRWGGSDGAERPRRPVARAEDAQDELVHENERLRMENALLRGQLQGHEGVPQQWPTGLPAGYRPEGFDSRAEALVKAVPGVQLASTDCDEYPCIAFYRIDDPTQPLDELLRDPLTAIWGDDANVMLTGLSSTDDDGRSFSFAAVAATPDEDAPDVDSIRLRVNARIEPTVEEMRGEAMREGTTSP